MSKKHYIKIKAFISKYYWVAGMPFIIWGLLRSLQKEEAITQNKTETFGMVYSSTPIYKQYSKRNYKYEFYYNGKKYTGSSSAYNSKTIENGNFYKVEFSEKNPEYNRMIFDLEYIRQIHTNANGKLDTIYIQKSEKFKDAIKKRIEKYKIKPDSLKN